MDDNTGATSSGYTVLLTVTADREMADYREYNQWMTGLRHVIGATPSTGAPMRNELPWTVGDQYGRWVEDHYGVRTFDRTPYANVWQTNIGGDVRSLAMAYVWVAIHLIQPLEDAGYNIQNTWCGLSDEMVLIA